MSVGFVIQPQLEHLINLDYPNGVKFTLSYIDNNHTWRANCQACHDSHMVWHYEWTENIIQEQLGGLGFIKQALLKHAKCHNYLVQDMAKRIAELEKNNGALKLLLTGQSPATKPIVSDSQPEYPSYTEEVGSWFMPIKVKVDKNAIKPVSKEFQHLKEAEIEEMLKRIRAKQGTPEPKPQPELNRRITLTEEE